MTDSEEPNPAPKKEEDAAIKINDTTTHPKGLAGISPKEAQSALAEALGAPFAQARTQTACDDKAQAAVTHIGQGESGQKTGNPFTLDEAQHEDTDDCVDIRMVEALLFAATEPLDMTTLQARLPDGARLDTALDALQAHYEKRGINLRKINNKWQFITAKDLSFLLEKERVQPRKLSRAVLETLAIIAYHQPCSRAEIEEIRGVAVSRGTLDTVLEIGWVRLRGRRDTAPGRPMLYGTTQNFLEHFDLASISHLPGMTDLKTAGLLDAHLPPDFMVPIPKEQDSPTASDEEGIITSEKTFVQDFLEDDETH